MTAATPTYNPFYPGGYAQQLRIQRNQQLAGQLTQESMQPIQVPYGSRASQFQGMNKLAQALIGAGEGNQAINEAQQYNQNYMQNAGSPSQGGTPQAGGGAPQQGDARIPPGQRYANGVPALFGDQLSDAIAFQQMGPPEYYKAVAAAISPTTEQKNVNSGNPDLAFKTTFVPPVEVRPGGGSALDPKSLKPVFSTPDATGYRMNPDGSSMSPVPIAPQGQASIPGSAVGAASSGPQGEGPFGGNAPVPAATDRIPAPGGSPNLQNANAQAPESPTNLGISVNSPAAPQTLPEAIAAQAANKAGKVTGAEDTAKNLAEAQKTYAAATSALPQVLQRFQDMQAVAKNASSGYGIDPEGEGWKVKAQQSWNGDTSQANAIMRQKPAQNIIAELGPQLAQGGLRGNKFLETLASKASGISLDDSPTGKQAAIAGLQTTYIGNLKAEAAVIRAQGGQAPSDAEIDAQVAKIGSGLHQEGQTATNPQTGKKAFYHYGQWTTQ